MRASHLTGSVTTYLARERPLTAKFGEFRRVTVWTFCHRLQHRIEMGKMNRNAPQGFPLLKLFCKWTLFHVEVFSMQR